jgi:hypothetical protein
MKKNFAALGVAIFAFFHIQGFAFDAAENHLEDEIRLVSPERNRLIKVGKVTFNWVRPTEGGDSDSPIDHYELSIWSRKWDYYQTIRIDAKDETSYTIPQIRKVIKRQGKYYWRLAAVYGDRNRKISKISSFIVGIDATSYDFTGQRSTFEVSTQHVKRLESPEFVQFLEQVTSKAQLESYTDFNLIFSQNHVFGRSVSLQERFSFLSQIGMGGEFTAKFLLHRNLYFALSPVASVSGGWFSTGLKNYSSFTNTVKIGAQLAVMPRGSLILQGAWIPEYRIRYAVAGNVLRTFEGRGWEFGFRLILPKDMMKPIKILGFDIDFRRIPFEFHVSQVRDEYTGVKMKMHRFSVGYQLM